LRMKWHNAFKYVWLKTLIF